MQRPSQSEGAITFCNFNCDFLSECDGVLWKQCSKVDRSPFDGSDLWVKVQGVLGQGKTIITADN